MRKVRQKIERLELHHAAQVGRDLPALANLREILDQHRDRQPALHFELAVDARLRLLQHLGREVGGDNVDAPARDGVAHLPEADRERIRLLAGRGGGAPDADTPLRRARRQQRRHDHVAEIFERGLVAEEERLVGGHRLDHFDGERLRVRAVKVRHQFGEPGKAGLARQRQQPALDQVLLVARQIESGAILQKFA